MATAPLTPFRRLGRGRQTAAVEQIAELTAEVAALEAERYEVATEVRALSSRIQLAVHADRPDVALHVAGRLDALAASLFRRGIA